MGVDAKRLNEDGEYAAQFFSQFGTDVNAAQRKLSEEGATEVNLFQVVLSLSAAFQEVKGVGTQEADQAILDNPDTPESQKDAVQRGMDLTQKADEEAAAKSEKASAETEQKPGVITGDKTQEAPKSATASPENQKPATPNQPTASSGIDL